MSVLAKLFSGKSKTPELIKQPKNFIECLDTVRVWNVQLTYNLDVDINDDNLQAALDTLVTCPYCSESFYFGNAVEFTQTKLTVSCPHCHTSPSEDGEEYVA